MTRFADVATSERVAQRLEALFAALYRALGEAATTTTNDGATIALHQFARRSGLLVARLHDFGPHRAGAVAPSREPDEVLYGVLRDAAAEDETALVLLYVLVVDVLPRLLITLRDVPENTTLVADGPLAELARDAAAIVVTQLHEFAELLRARHNEAEGVASSGLSRYDERLAIAGFGENFGLDLPH